MKNLLLLFLVVFSLVSCSTDDDSQLRRINENPGPHNTFVMNLNAPVNLIAIRINNDEGHTIENYEYQNVQDVSLDISSGVEIMVYVVTNGYFEYNYFMYNNDDSLQFQGFQQGNENHTLVKIYTLQIN